jgi:hypothetical protein
MDFVQFLGLYGGQYSENEGYMFYSFPTGLDSELGEVILGSFLVYRNGYVTSVKNGFISRPFFCFLHLWLLETV